MWTRRKCKFSHNLKSIVIFKYRMFVRPRRKLTRKGPSMGHLGRNNGSCWRLLDLTLSSVVGRSLTRCCIVYSKIIMASYFDSLARTCKLLQNDKVVSDTQNKAVSESLNPSSIIINIFIDNANYYFFINISDGWA